MRFLRRSLTGLFLLSLTAGFLAWAGMILLAAIEARNSDGGRPATERERVFTVDVTTVEPQRITPVLSAYGEIRSRRMLDLRASAAGRIIELHDAFVEGGQVAADDLLLRVDPAAAQFALSRAQTDVQEAQAEERDARRGLELAAEELATIEAQVALRQAALERQLDLKQRGVGTDAAVETAELAASAANQSLVNRRQALQQAEARVDFAATGLTRQRLIVAEAERTLADTELRAEFSGTLGDVTVVQGGLVAANEKLGTLTDPGQLEVSFRVSTSQYARLLDGDGGLIASKIRVVLDVFGIDIVTEGMLTRESASVGEGRTGRLLFATLDAPRGFRPGDFVTVEVEEPALNNVIRLPATAVDAAGEVLVLGDDDRLESALVEVLRRQGDDVILRADTLNGRSVVLARTPLLGEGILVRPIRDGAPVETIQDMVELTEERRATLVAFVETNGRMPADAKERVLAQLREPLVPRQVVERIESRIGG